MATRFIFIQYRRYLFIASSSSRELRFSEHKYATNVFDLYKKILLSLFMRIAKIVYAHLVAIHLSITWYAHLTNLSSVLLDPESIFSVFGLSSPSISKLAKEYDIKYRDAILNENTIIQFNNIISYFGHL